MKLADLAEQVIRAAPTGMLTEQMLYASLDFRGSRNAHLAIPAWHDDPEFVNPEMLRHEFLTGGEEILGDVHVFSYCAQDRQMILEDVATLAEASAIVLGGAGVFNGWMDVILVFEGGRLRPYHVSYCNSAGARVVLDRKTWKPFNDKPFLQRQIHWLEVAA